MTDETTGSMQVGEAQIAAAAPPPRVPERPGLPRAVMIILGLAGGVVVAAGMRAVPGIIGPVFLALVLTITVDPIRGWLIRRGASRAVASGAVFLTVFAIMVGLLVAAAFGIVQLVTLMPQYSDQIQQELSGLQTRLAGIGVTQADIQSVFASISPSQIASFAESLLSSISGVFSFVLFMLVVAIFLRWMPRCSARGGRSWVRVTSRCSPRWGCSPGEPGSTSASRRSSVASSPSWTARPC
jgi:predicted PurR-regulated permease PerM